MPPPLAPHTPAPRSGRSAGRCRSPATAQRPSSSANTGEVEPCAPQVSSVPASVLLMACAEERAGELVHHGRRGGGTCDQRGNVGATTRHGQTAVSGVPPISRPHPVPFYCNVRLPDIRSRAAIEPGDCGQQGCHSHLVQTRHRTAPVIPDTRRGEHRRCCTPVRLIAEQIQLVIVHHRIGTVGRL
jgi:hypothetical protein